MAESLSDQPADSDPPENVDDPPPNEAPAPPSDEPSAVPTSEPSASDQPPWAQRKSRAENYHPNFNWMREHIGDALVRGITETLLLRPEDPIEYLGQWLAQQARNIELDKRLLQERAQILAEKEEVTQRGEERARLVQERTDREQQRKEAVFRAQEESKQKVEAEQRAKELEVMRAGRTENRGPLGFGVPETIPEVPSININGDTDET